MNAPFASILVPYDGSEPARAALDLALCAMHPGATLSIVNVVDESPIIAQSATAVTAFDPSPLLAGLDEQAHARTCFHVRRSFTTGRRRGSLPRPHRSAATSS